MPTSIPVSAFPKTIQEDATDLDLDRDGAIGTNDVAHVIDKLENTNSTIKVLGRTTKYFAALSILLVLCVLGSSIAAARLSRDIEVDTDSGFAFVKGSGHHSIMKTQEALVWKNDNVVDATASQLASIKDILINDGDIRFVVKGTARVADTNDVILLVEGGTLHFSDEGLVGVTGDAMILIKASLGDNYSYEDGREDERRMLSHSCSISDLFFSFTGDFP